MKKQFNQEMLNALAIDEKNRQNFRPKLADESDIDYSRAVYNHCRAHWNRLQPDIARVNDSTINNTKCRIYNAHPDKQCDTVIIFAHGGGWIVGNLDTHDRICRKIVADAMVDCVAVDYSLAPTVRHPTPIIEVFGVLQALQQQYQRVILAGDSAGAHIALAVSYHCTRVHNPQPDGLILIYGAFGLIDSPSFRLFGADEYYGLTTDDMTRYVKLYCGDDANADSLSRDKYFNLLANDLSETPPCLVISSQCDALRDDSRALSELLGAFDIPTIYLEYGGVVHGFLHYSEMVERARHALIQICAFANQKLVPKVQNTMIAMVENAKAQITNIDIATAQQLINSGEYQLIDLRDIRELWRDGTIGGSFHTPRCMLEFWADENSPYHKPEFSRDKKYLLFCAAGWRSALAAKTMVDLGYDNVAHINGGFGAYQKSGAPIAPVAKKEA